MVTMSIQKQSSTQKQPGRWSPFHYQSDTAGSAPARFGLLLILPFLILFFLWSVLAPINAAAIAGGEVVLNDERKTVQHLEGGIVESLLVEEGQWVNKGEALLMIRDVRQRATVNTLYDKLLNARALYARLRAEQSALSAPDFSNLVEGLQVAEDRVQAVAALQTNIFNTNVNSLKTELDLIRSSQRQAENEIKALEAQKNAVKKRWQLENQELESISTLTQQGFSTKQSRLEVEKEVVNLEGQKGALAANIARLRQTIISADLQILEARNRYDKVLLEELKTAKQAMEEMTHSLRSIQDELSRTTVRAPVSGHVMDLQFHTVGAVVAPGARILEVVPNDDRLIIEAKLNPNDIELIKPGTKTKVQLTAYKEKKVPKLDGEVISISADIMTDQMTAERYFQVRVLLNEETTHKLNRNVTLYPGMPAQLFFIAGERTFANYMLSPITDTVYKAFRED